MRVLMPTVQFPPDPGGVATLAYEQAVGLAELGHRVRVEALERVPPEPTPPPPLGAEFFYRRIRTAPIWRIVPMTLNLVRSIREFRPDVVACPAYWGYALPVLVAARLTGRPYSLYLHGTELNTQLRTRARRAVMRKVLTGAACVFTNSENTRRLTLRAFPHLLGSVHPVLPGVHPERFADPLIEERGRALRRGWLESLEPASDPVVMISLCRMDRQKGIDKVLEAFAELRRTSPDSPLRYVAVGGGPDLAAFQEQARELGLDRFVHFAGPLPYDQAPAALKGADFYVQPSQPVGQFLESFGISFVEAQAAGLPCIGSDWGGVPEAVAAGTTAILVPPGDSTALITAIQALAGDGELRARMGNEGIARAAGMSWREHARKLAEHIRESALPPA